MIAGEEYRKIARIGKSYGADGELLMTLSGIYAEDIDIKEPVFVFFDGLPVPFFIEKFSEKGTGRLLVHLTGINCGDDAEEMAGRDVFLPESAFEAGEDGWEFLLGWTVLDTDSGQTAGIVSDVVDIPGNPCIELTGPDGSKPLLPLNEELIASIDEQGRILTMRIPEGLLSL